MVEASEGDVVEGVPEGAVASVRPVERGISLRGWPVDVVVVVAEVLEAIFNAEGILAVESGAVMV